jgi:CBS domain-containing protein
MKGHARNLMTEVVISLEPAASLTEMVRKFDEESLSGAPVVDESHRVIGFVSETDLLGALLGDNDSLTAGAIMSTPPIVVDEFMPMEDVMNLLRERQIRHLPVVRHGRLVGIITPRDILRYFVERVLPPAPRLA